MGDFSVTFSLLIDQSDLINYVKDLNTKLDLYMDISRKLHSTIQNKPASQEYK